MPRRNKGIFSGGFSVARVKEDTRLPPRRQDSLTDVIRRNTVPASYPNPYTRGVFEQRFIQQSLFGYFNQNLYLTRNLHDHHHNYFDDDDDDDYYDDDDDDDDDYEDDEDEYEDAVWAQSSTPSPLPPHPSLRQLTQEEADKHAKEVQEREQQLKDKLERRRLKKQRQKEKKRLEAEQKTKEGLCEEEPNQPSGSHDADITNNESEITPDQSDVTAETEDKSLDGDCTSGDPVEPRTAANIKRIISPSPRGQSDPPRGHSDSPRGHSDSPRGHSDSPRGQSDSPVPRERNGGGGGGRRRRKKTTTSRERRVPVREEPPVVPQTPPLPGADQQETNGTPEDYSQKTTELAACGHRLASCGQYEQALEYFTEAIKYNPKEYRLFGNRSFCYERLQQYGPALRDAEQALSLEPGWTKGLFRQGKALCGLQRYHDASLTYKTILQQEGSSEEATRELKRAQTLHLMEMGFSRAEAGEALAEHGSLEEALEALFVGGAEPEEGSCRDTPTQRAAAEEEEEEEEEQEEQEQGEEDDGWTVLGRSRPHQARRRNAASKAVTGAPKWESYSVWVGSMSPTLTTPALHQLFSRAGEVTNVKILVEQRCAFVDYARTEECDRAIQLLNGFVVEGVPLAVRYPNRFLSEMNGQHGYPLPHDRNSKECYYWRTNGCVKLVGCLFQHIPEHKHIDRGKPGH